MILGVVLVNAALRGGDEREERGAEKERLALLRAEHRVDTIQSIVRARRAP